VSEDVRIVVGRIDVPREMFRDRWLEASVVRVAHRLLYPWEFPDPPVTFDVTLFPRLERLARWARKVRESFGPLEPEDYL
jgi:hypothetical protein